MTDISAIPNISEVMKQFGYQAGYAIDQRLKKVDTDIRTHIDERVAILTGQDAQFSTVINNLLRITDAQPGSPEWDEGQNLYTLMTNNYVGLVERIEAQEDATASLNSWKTQFVADYNTSIANINQRIDDEVANRQQAVEYLQGQIDSNKNAIAAANTARENLKNALEDADAAQVVEIDALKQRVTKNENDILSLKNRADTLASDMLLRVDEIKALQAKRDEFEGRISTLESKFVGLNAENPFNEFAAGLSGQESPTGIQPPTLQ